jgi:hypothetical protein
MENTLHLGTETRNCKISASKHLGLVIREMAMKPPLRKTFTLYEMTINISFSLKARELRYSPSEMPYTTGKPA